MNLDELFVEYGDKSYFEIDRLWDDGKITWAEKAILQSATEDYKLFQEDMENGRIYQTQSTIS